MRGSRSQRVEDDSQGARPAQGLACGAGAASYASELSQGVGHEGAGFLKLSSRPSPATSEGLDLRLNECASIKSWSRRPSQERRLELGPQIRVCVYHALPGHPACAASATEGCRSADVKPPANCGSPPPSMTKRAGCRAHGNWLYAVFSKDGHL